jgi:AAA+ superfamily predicted ATPase
MFELDKVQQAKLKAWLEEIKPEILEAQKRFSKSAPQNAPYYGMVGGGLTYSFTPCSIGTTVEVTEYHTKKTIDLSDYDSW